jgi:ribonuclease HI
MAGCYCPLSNLLSLAMAEAKALLTGLEFLERLGISNVMIESDSLELIQACNGVIEVCHPHSAVLA